MEDICGIFQLPKKYSVFLSLACWSLSFEFSRTFLESLSKSWGFQLSPRGLNSDFQWIWQMICLICWWNYQKCTHFVVIHNNTFSNFKFRIVQDRNLEYFLGDMKNDSHFLKESHLYSCQLFVIWIFRYGELIIQICFMYVLLIIIHNKNHFGTCAELEI